MLHYNVHCNNKTVMCTQKRQTSLKSCVVHKALVAGWWYRVMATTQHLHQLTECAEEGLIEACGLLHALPSDFSLMPPCLTGILRHHFKALVTAVLHPLQPLMLPFISCLPLCQGCNNILLPPFPLAWNAKQTGLLAV